MKFWIARDGYTGSVHLFEQKPVKDGRVFVERTNFDEGMYLGKRPKLSFKLRRGQTKKVTITCKEA